MDLISLPAGQARVATILAHLAADGACLLTGLDASSTNGLLAWAERLGNWDLGIEEELLGSRIMHMRFDPEKVRLAQQPAYFTSDEFPLHTDVSYVSNPPGLMLLHCVQPDSAGGGKVIISSCEQAFAQLSLEHQATLQWPVFSFRYPPGCPEGRSKPAAIRSGDCWRFKFASMEFAPEHAAAVDAFYAALLQSSQTIQMQAGDLLVLDNHRMAHGRTAFHGAGRHIMRCYINPLS